MSGPRNRFSNTDIDFNVLESLMKLGATCTDCSGHFRCSNATIVQRIKEQYNMNYSELSDKMMSTVRLKLRQRMYDSAMAGNTGMLVWLSKQWLNMSDNPLPPATDMSPYPDPFQTEVTPEDEKSDS